MNTRMNRIYAPLIFALSIFIAIFSLRPTYTEYMDIKTKENGIKNTQKERQQTMDALTSLQSSFRSQSGSDTLIKKVKKLDKKWNEASVLSAVMLTDYTKSTQIIQAPIEIRSISLDKGKKLPSGLGFGAVQMTIESKNIDDIVDFLTYLTTDSEYAFVLDSISLPLAAPVPKDGGIVSLTLSLGVYYYE